MSICWQLMPVEGEKSTFLVMWPMTGNVLLILVNGFHIISTEKAQGCKNNLRKRKMKLVCKDDRCLDMIKILCMHVYIFKALKIKRVR